jgi:hypothetical protein
MNPRTAAGLALATLLAAPSPASAQAGSGREMEARPLAVLQSLDKGTARTATFEVPVGEARRFGTLTVRVRACREALPIDPPESAAFLEVWDTRPNEAAVGIFSGWMFASSPALSAIEHPLYDVWVMECRNAPTSASPSTASPPAPGNRAVR